MSRDLYVYGVPRDLRADGVARLREAARAIRQRLTPTPRAGENVGGPTT